MTYATNMTTFWLEGATTVTSIGTGAAGLGNPETDFFIQGSGCISKAAWTNAVKGFIIDGLGANFTVPTDGAIIAFAKYDAAGSLDIKANGGLRMIIGSGSGDYYNYYIGGSDTLAFDSWVPYTIDPNTATSDATSGTPSGSERWVGLLGNLPTTSGPTKGNPIAMDAIRYGRCDIEYTSTGNTFSGAEAFANDPSRRWGLIALRNGSYLIQGFHSFGTSGASCTFSDSNKSLFILPSGNNNLTNDSVSTGFNRLEILHADTSVTWDNISISALGTRARGVFVHTDGTVLWTNCQFTDMDTFSFLAAATCTGATFRRCNAVTAPGTLLTNTRILAPTVAANAAGLVWDVATDPDGRMDGMQFSKGTAAHHAIEFGTSSPTTMTLRNCDFTGFSSSADNDGSVFRFLRTSGAVTLNLVGCTHDGSGFTVDDRAGCTVTVVIDPVTTTVTVRDNTGALLQNARVYLEAADGTAALPFEDSVSISVVSTTATVTHTAHGMADGDQVMISGCNQSGYNGAKTITYIDANSYSYTVVNAGAATGTIIATGILLNELTTAGGIADDTRSISTAQPVTGWVRKSSGAPYFKTFPISGTVSTTSGLSINVQMILDQ